jgi:hypothetical protein
MQSRWMSLVESVANVLVGYIVAVTTQYLVFPLFGLHATLSQNLMIGLIFTGVSLVRSYLLRRAFEARRLKADWLTQAKSSSSMAACTTNPVK